LLEWGPEATWGGYFGVNKETAMTDEELQLSAQRDLQEFDDARDKAGVDIQELGRKAIVSLDSFIAYWRDKPYMQAGWHVDATGGGHDDLKEYAERQIGWAEEEKTRVRSLLTPSSSES
jgi:hypothetical protein